MPYTDHFLTLDNRRVGYVDEGPKDAPCVVLLHGGAFDHAELSWRLAVPVLRKLFRVVAPDLPGYGESAGIGGQHSLADLGEWLVRFLDALGLAQVHLAGVSMGGGMALWLALCHPGRVDRLVPVSSYGLMDRAPLHPLAWLVSQSSLRSVVYRAAASNRNLARIGLGMHYAKPSRITERTIDELVSVARDQLTRQSFDGFLKAEVSRTGLIGSLKDRLPELTAPTLFIHGTRDRLVPVRHAREAARLVPGARLELMETGHWPMRELPGEFNETLLRFLTE